MIDIKDCWLKDRCKKYGECNDFCIKLFKINELSNLALLDNVQRVKKPLWIDSDGADKEAFTYLQSVEKDIENFVAQGGSIYIYSPITGNGKTAWSLRLVNAYIEKIWYKSDLVCRALFINVPRFLLSLKDSISNNNEYYNSIKSNIYSADLVVFDEIGTKTATTFELENLLSIVNTRANKANIYTSNLRPEELKLAVGDRMYSRIINCSKQVMFKGSDKRGL